MKTTIKMNALVTRMKLGKKALAMLTPVLLSPAAFGIVTVHFVEEGDDVRVSFSGTLDLTGAPGTDSTDDLNAANSTVSSLGINAGGPNAFIQDLGFLPENQNNFSLVNGAAVTDAFGFSDVFLVWSARNVTQGAPGGVVTELTADPDLDTFVLEGQDLDSLGADANSIAEGTILWTSNGDAGDTFVFSRLSPAGDPEPEPEPEPEPLVAPAIRFIISEGRPGIEFEFPSEQSGDVSFVLQEAQDALFLPEDGSDVDASPAVVSDDLLNQVIQIIHPELLSSAPRRFLRLEVRPISVED